MGRDTIEAAVRLDAKTFRAFASFDTLVRQGRWKSPVIFALILLAASGVCFIFRGQREGAVLLASVLAGVGLGLPAVYFGSFFLSVRAQNKRFGLSSPRQVYTVSLGDGGVRVIAGGEEASFGWETLHRAYRVRGCTYLYATPARAFLLPDGCVERGPDALWAMLEAGMGREKLFDRRRR